MMDYRNVYHVSKISLLFIFTLAAAAERTPVGGTAELLQTLDRLNTLGSVLMVAAHPDDENTAVIAYFARGRHMRTAYLSATRGEGGQNLIGSEQYEALGLIRTQELLMARHIDGGEQFFTRAFDFGFSKNPEESLAKWNRDLVLGDFVRIIRQFRPDVIISRWHPTGTSGHGHHTAAGHLAPVAFAAAADPQQFPEQIRERLQPWQARRLIWNTFTFGRQQEDTAPRGPTDGLVIDAGEYDFVLGKSYAEIAGESRTRHASQGFGSAERKGPQRQYFQHVAGDPARKDPFDGIDTTWNRVPGAARLGDLLRRARVEVDVRHPDRLLPVLLDAWREMQGRHDPWTEVKRPELLHAIELAAGLQLEATTNLWDVTPGSTVPISVTALSHASTALAWERTEITGVAHVEAPGNRPRLQVTIPPGAPYSQPCWLREPRTGDSYAVKDPACIGVPESPPVLVATFHFRAAGDLLLPFRVPVRYRWVDRVYGELTRSVEIVPLVSVSFATSAMIFPQPGPRTLVVRVASHTSAAKGAVSLQLPAGWKADPATAPFALTGRDHETTVTFLLTPPASAASGYITAQAALGGAAVSVGLVSIHHPHIPPQTLFPPARVRVERFDVRMTAKNIGYVMGAGDEVPRALEQLGATVRLLTPADLSTGDLSHFDAIVTGVRALNVRDDLLAARQRLLDYVAAGGTLLVQYNTSGGFGPDADTSTRAAQLAPYPLTPSANRVSVEEAPVTFPSPDHPVLQRPNAITARDFEGWVQERGLYFMSAWDKRYQPLFASNDPGEPSQQGGTLFARHGKGVYIYTGYSWFRQLPAGVPGAYRVVANLVSAK
jgi:LmbE family N-acetylglucosaminyl deacetylase